MNRSTRNAKPGMAAGSSAKQIQDNGHAKHTAAAPATQRPRYLVTLDLDETLVYAECRTRREALRVRNSIRRYGVPARALALIEAAP